MALLPSRSPSWTPNLPPNTTVNNFLSTIKAYVSKEVSKATDVSVAQTSIVCDGLSAINALNGSDCCSDCGPSYGPTVLVNIKNGVPTLLTTNVSRPLSGAGSGSVTASSTITGGSTSELHGRFFVDVEGNLYEGRNGRYHAAPSFPRYPNGTPLNVAVSPITPTAELEDGDLKFGFGMLGTESNPHPAHEVIRRVSGAWETSSIAVVGTPSAAFQDPPPSGPYRYRATGYSPHFCLTESRSSLDHAPNAIGGQADFPITGTSAAKEREVREVGWLGRSDSTDTGYRPSNFAVFSIAGWDSISHQTTDFQTDSTHYEVRLCAWNPEMAWSDGMSEPFTFVKLSEVQEYAQNFPERNTVEGLGVFPWRAGIQVRPASDGTLIISIINSSKAWVYEPVMTVDGEGKASYSFNLLERVTLPYGYSFLGNLRVIYL